MTAPRHDALELAEMLEAVVKERDALRESLLHACSLMNSRYDNAREIWAIRETVNWLGAPFSHERVQEKYDEYQNEMDRLTKERSEALGRAVTLEQQRDTAIADLYTTRSLLDAVTKAHDELAARLNTPHTADFLSAVTNEAAHQVARWGVEHDAGKTVEDWAALFVRLLGKMVDAHWNRRRREAAPSRHHDRSGRGELPRAADGAARRHRSGAGCGADRNHARRRP